MKLLPMGQLDFKKKCVAPQVGIKQNKNVCHFWHTFYFVLHSIPKYNLVIIDLNHDKSDLTLDDFGRAQVNTI